MLIYTGVRVRDLDRSRRFYTEGLGLRFKTRGRMAAGGIWEELEDPETHALLELNFYPGDQPYREGDELDHLGFEVRDLDLWVRKLESLGAKVRIAPFREGPDRLVFLSDPDGIWIELSERIASDLPPTSKAVD
jgi:lactoylglutathione lyase